MLSIYGQGEMAPTDRKGQILVRDEGNRGQRLRGKQGLASELLGAWGDNSPIGKVIGTAAETEHSRICVSRMVLNLRAINNFSL